MSALLQWGGGVLAVDPVPWARAQMAFTLASHIILVPLGVSWACMALIASTSQGVPTSAMRGRGGSS